MSIYSEITRVKNAKAAIKAAIAEKGVDAGNGKLDTYAEKIGQIHTGDGVPVSVIERTATFVNIPVGTTKIGNNAFYNYGALTSVTIPSTVTSIGSYAFGSSGLTSVTIPEGVTAINSSAFSYCTKLVSVSLPTTVVTIQQNAFNGCSALTALTIPANVTTIGATALNIGSASAKATLTVKSATPPTIQANTIGANVEKIIVPVFALDAYRSATNWAAYADIIEAEAPVGIWYITSVNETDYGSGGEVDFVSCGQPFYQFLITEGEGVFYDNMQVYFHDNTYWADENFRIVSFYEAPDESLATWLENCAVPITEIWRLSGYPTPPVDEEGELVTFDTDFVSNGERFHTIQNNGTLSYGDMTAFGVALGWTNSNYQTLYFVEAPSGELLTWLQANATRQG